MHGMLQPPPHLPQILLQGLNGAVLGNSGVSWLLEVGWGR